MENETKTEQLKKRASELAGREVEVEQTKHGKYIVLWMRFEQSPPPVGDTEDEALQGFIDYRLKSKNFRDTLATDDTKLEETNEDRV